MDQAMTSRQPSRFGLDDPKPAAVASPPPESPAALAELADASQRYSVAASAFIAARRDLNEARDRFIHLRDIVAKTTEQDAV